MDRDTGFTPSVLRNTSSAVEYLGSYGNADPLDVSQWIEVPVASSADTASWDDKRWAPMPYEGSEGKDGKGSDPGCLELGAHQGWF